MPSEQADELNALELKLREQVASARTKLDEL
jgi:hypothetical protein